MSRKISRREFLKATGLGAAATAVLVGSGSVARYVRRHLRRHLRRQPSSGIPQYTAAGLNAYFATTCGECPASCGLLVRTTEGRAYQVDGNPVHPVNTGNTCSRSQAALHGLYDPGRISGPRKQNGRGSRAFQPLDWDVATLIVQEALQSQGETVFLLGLFPDHLADLVQLMAIGLTGASVLRFAASGEYEARVTLMDASQKLFGVSKIPYFDLERTDVIFSFGANFSETWLSPVAYSRAYEKMRQSRGGYLVQFEPRLSQIAAGADEWVPIKPGSELVIAQALHRLVEAILRGGDGQFAGQLDVADAAAASGMAVEDLRRLAQTFANAPRKVALPGGIPLGQTNGLAAAEAILRLNSLANNLGMEGGLWLTPDSPIFPNFSHRPSSLAELAALVERMKSGRVKTLLIHGVNPVHALPKALGFAGALANVPLVISFSPFLDETAELSDYIFPDHTPLESWGYQKVVTGADRPVISAIQPVIAPVLDTRATADVLLAAYPGPELPYTDEGDFLQRSVSVLMEMDSSSSSHSSSSADNRDFWHRWLKSGGWWASGFALEPPTATLQAIRPGQAPEANFSGDENEYPLTLMLYPSLGDDLGTGQPRLAGSGDCLASSLQSIWVEIHPETAQKMGLSSDDLVCIRSPKDEIEAVVYEYAAIHPDVIAIPLILAHTVQGRNGKGQHPNPQDLLNLQYNESGGLAFAATRVQVIPTGKRRPQPHDKS